MRSPLGGRITHSTPFCLFIGLGVGCSTIAPNSRTKSSTKLEIVRKVASLACNVRTSLEVIRSKERSRLHTRLKQEMHKYSAMYNIQIEDIIYTKVV